MYRSSLDWSGDSRSFLHICACSAVCSILICYEDHPGLFNVGGQGEGVSLSVWFHLKFVCLLICCKVCLLICCKVCLLFGCGKVCCMLPQVGSARAIVIANLYSWLCLFSIWWSNLCLLLSFGSQILQWEDRQLELLVTKFCLQTSYLTWESSFVKVLWRNSISLVCSFFWWICKYLRVLKILQHNMHSCSSSLYKSMWDLKLLCLYTSPQTLQVTVDGWWVRRFHVDWEHGFGWK